MAEYLKLNQNSSLYRKGIAHIGRSTDLGSLSLGAGSAVAFAETSFTNDSTGVTVSSTTQIILAANRRYNLSGFVSAIHSSTTVATYRFYNVTAAAYIGSIGRIGALTYASNASYSNPPQAFITPAVNTTIELRIETISSGTLSTVYAGSHVVVEEVEAYIPSTSLVDYVIENGSNSNGSYTKWFSGKLEQWGRRSQTATPTTYSLPTSFLNTSYTLVLTADNSSATLATCNEVASARTISAFGVGSWVTTTGANANTVFNWHAIGQWK